MLQFNVFAVLLIISALATGVLAAVLFSRVGQAGRHFAWMMVSLSIWAVAYAFELTSTTLEGMMFWIKIEYIGIGLIPGFWMTFCLSFTGQTHILTKRNIALLFLVPVTTILMVWTNQWHNLHYISYQVAADTPFPMLDFARGPWYLVHMFYFYALLIWGIILLFRNYNNAAPIYKKQTLVVLAGTLIPWFGNALYHLGFRPYEYLDLTPFIFTLTGMAIGLGLIRFQLFDVIPVARDKVVEGLEEGVIVFDNKFRVVYYNHSMVRLLGGKKIDYTGLKVTELPSYFSKLERLLGSEKGGKIELLIESPTEDAVNVMVVATNLIGKTPQSTGTILIFRDITEQRRTEAELVMARLKAEESDRLKSAFLANMSHEIRNPMNGIIGFAGILRDPELTEEERNHYLSVIEDNSEQLLLIINDIIDISKIEAGQDTVRVASLSVQKLLEDVAHSIEPQIIRRGLTFKYRSFLENSEDNILSDRQKLRQILINLLSNAMKFTEVGQIVLNANLIDGLLTLSVRDTGKGIEPEKIQLVFDRFQQLDQDSQYISRGTGLGLAISRGYAELLGGDISVTSSPGNGSTFFVKIPHIPTKDYTEQANPFMSEKSSAIPDWTGKKIILAEDEPVNIMYMKIALKKTNVELILAETGQQAVDAYTSNTDVDVILLDIKMPVMDGFEAAEKISGMGCKAPLVALSGHAMLEKERIEKAGFTHLISKPIRKDDLLSKLGEWLG
ncbi:MAG: response regulator [Bacteroidetes bacterium]|nr:response regulator [Bacteroidota bacterium]MCH8524030.1 response regulator [Balneolales bacterium]